MGEEIKTKKLHMVEVLNFKKYDIDKIMVMVEQLVVEGGDWDYKEMMGMVGIL